MSAVFAFSAASVVWYASLQLWPRYMTHALPQPQGVQAFCIVHPSCQRVHVVWGGCLLRLTPGRCTGLGPLYTVFDLASSLEEARMALSALSTTRLAIVQQRMALRPFSPSFTAKFVKVRAMCRPHPVCLPCCLALLPPPAALWEEAAPQCPSWPQMYVCWLHIIGALKARLSLRRGLSKGSAEGRLCGLCCRCV